MKETDASAAAVVCCYVRLTPPFSSPCALCGRAPARILNVCVRRGVCMFMYFGRFIGQLSAKTYIVDIHTRNTHFLNDRTQIHCLMSVCMCVLCVCYACW